MKANNKILFFLTQAFPYGTGETFIENELPFLSLKFNKIFIIPKFVNYSEKRSLPKNVFVIKPRKSQKNINKLFIIKNLVFILKIIFFELLKSKNRKYYLHKIREFKSYIANQIAQANKFYELIELNSKASDNLTIYSYWFDERTLLLAILKDIKKIPNLFIRAHGYDLFKERTSLGFFLFRSYVLNYATKVFSVSKSGDEYIKNDYSIFKNKIKYSYLGVNYNGKNNIDKTHIFTIVSCSSLIKLKRVHLIIEILKHIKFKINWYHFGSGILSDEVEKKSQNLPNNVKANFAGQITNKELITFYKNISVDLFINVSEYEGIPVSIMEATSFGIPIIATNTGGTKEIVCSATGFLLEKNFNINTAVKIITNLKESNDKDISRLRQSTFNYWNTKFNAETNYNKFIDYLV